MKVPYRLVPMAVFVAALTALAACESRVGGFALVTPTNTSGLVALSVSSGTLSPAFSPSVTSYTDNVTNSTTTITVTPTVSADASVSVNGTATTSGVASQSIPLAVGSNTVNIAVQTSGGTSKTYVVNVIRAA